MAFDITKPAGNDSVGSSAPYIRENFRALLQDKFTQGSTTPSSATGIDGYLFFNTTEKILYEKISGVWTAVVAVDVPDATASTKGKMKLYTSTGNSTDGTMTRAAITNALASNDADSVDGYHASSLAKIAEDNNFITNSNEFNFVPSGYSSCVWLNYRTAGGTNGAITEYKLGNGAGSSLGDIAAIAAQGSDYIKFSNGFKICWGLKSDSSASGSISYPGGGFSYSSYVASSTCSNYGHEKWIRITAAYTTYFNYGGADGYNGSFYWIAVGF